MHDSAWRERVTRILGRRTRFQFGQPPATTTLVGGGTVACTDCCIQVAVLLTKGVDVSLNEVRRRSGAPSGQPLTANEALRALRSFDLPYEIRNDLRGAALLKVAREKGPVIVCELYWAHPQWHGYEYLGRTLNGYSTSYSGRKVRPGFARPEHHAGLTQWTFRDGHAVLLACDAWEGKVHQGIVRDPNHASGSRPERPAYDLVNVRQLDRMVDSYAMKYGFRVALAPARDIRRAG
jgi:hypothetical protein